MEYIINIYLEGEKKKTRKSWKLSTQGATNTAVPSTKRNKEKGLKLHQRRIGVLKIFVIAFLPKTPQEARRHYLLQSSTLKCDHQSTNKQTSQLLY
jgi:hypothetical protein